MKNLIYSLFILIFVIPQSGNGQTITPAPGRVWGGQEVSYKRGDFDLCKIGWKVTNGVFPEHQNSTSITQSSENQTVKVKWNNISTLLGEIEFTRTECFNKSNNSTTQPYPEFIILSLNNQNVGNITGPVVPQCSTTPVSFSIPKREIPHSFENNVFKYASGYEWTIPAGWVGPNGQTGTFLIHDPNANSISLTPKSCADGQEIIRVRAYTNAFTDSKNFGHPHYSNYSQNYTVNRSPLSITTPSQIKCGVPFEASVTALACATGYNWAVPSEWMVSGTGSTVTITPRSTSGTISVNIAAQGGCTLPVSKEVNPIFIPVINGNSNICSSGTTLQLGDIPAGATATWSVSPTNLVSSSSGTGTSVTLYPTLSSTTGSATITFNVTGVCGSKSVSRPIWIGNPLSARFYLSGSAFYNREAGPMSAFETRTSEWVTIRPEINTQVANVLQYEWTITGPHTSGPVNLTASTLTYRTPDNPNVQVTISLRMRNSCGWSAWRSATIWTRGGGEEPWFIFPNPSSDVFTVQHDSDEFKTSETTAEYDLVLYSEDGKEVLTKRKNKGRKVTLSVAHLKKGDYYLHIIQGDAVIRRKVRIQ